MHDDYLNFAKDLALKSGAIIKQNFKAGMVKDWKSDNTPVTETDLAINKMVIEEITKEYPDHGVWGEEESKESDSKYVWVVDPIDGTVPFSHGLPISTFSLALTEDGESIVGVVYDPYQDRLFYASKGGGTFMNDDPISVSGKDTLENALIDLEGGLKEKVLEMQDVESELVDIGAHVTSIWSVILPSALVASGEYTATIFNNPKPEDGAAISLIVTEAGGKVTDLDGQEQKYNQPTKGFVASNGLVHQEILDIIKAKKIGQ
ncbi:MAG: inositol monophosphatase [Patescibacteria group bacterium]